MYILIYCTIFQFLAPPKISSNHLRKNVKIPNAFFSQFYCCYHTFCNLSSHIAMATLQFVCIFFCHYFLEKIDFDFRRKVARKKPALQPCHGAIIAKSKVIALLTGLLLHASLYFRPMVFRAGEGTIKRS